MRKAGKLAKLAKPAKSAKSAKSARIMLVGTGSGCGKTTAVCGLLSALKQRGVNAASFKCGPDYIDPMFHSEVLGVKSRNLDLFMCGEGIVKQLFCSHAENAEVSVIEGVMGVYDGIAYTEEFSSNHLATLLNSPQIIVVNPKGMSLSLVAALSGYLGFAENNIRGVILNQVSASMYEFYKKLLDEKLHIRCYGYIPIVEEAKLESRHLGLITAGEICDIKQKLKGLGEICEKTLDIDGILELSKAAPELITEPLDILNEYSSVKVGVALDKAFCFYYQDSLELLKKLGAELFYFSPLNDNKLPDDIDCLILGGGYPEEFAGELSQNKEMLFAIKSALQKKMPALAECGGYMYLCKGLIDRQGVQHEMVAYFDIVSQMTKKLTRFGYVTLTAKEDNLVCKKGGMINAHEFHYSDSVGGDNGDSFVAFKKNGQGYSCIHADEQVYAGYPHIHLCGNIDFARQLLSKAKAYRNSKGRSGEWK